MVGLATAQLYQARDLAITTDFREPISAVLSAHMGLAAPQIDRVFPARPASSGNTAALLRT
ncbi:MAG: hypothetical protein IVW54_22440 [Candidatus Binataceae bacterium]|nr:hypothetical protein [Candidatus Binataceae bacterium]